MRFLLLFLILFAVFLPKCATAQTETDFEAQNVNDQQIGAIQNYRTISRPVMIREIEYPYFVAFFANLGAYFSETPKEPIQGKDVQQLSRRGADEVCEEPENVGGAECTEDSDCNSRAPSLYDDNYCLFSSETATTGICECAYDYAKTDCSYKRFDKNLAGGLEFLAFAGIGGVGNFVADRIGEGVGQLIMLFAPYLMCCAACCMFAGDKGAVGAVITYVVLILATLAGFIWCMVDGGLFLGGEYPDGNGYYPYNGDCVFVLG